ncbi:hypothetical protein MTP99_009590 [Tenebrio molitor]|jgi:secreted trypsin-like serine protease|uniref:brachyurin-like n=1 Tax=Tenebrio molitor TaxID=7067 RepID=UPI002707424D|nr:hypothetical protein MTP99_009590 [Tenebrio molitor]
MTKAVILVWCTCLIWAQAAHLKSADIGGRIIGGDLVTPGQLPFVAAIYKNTADGTFFCSGALKGTQWIITAGQCVDGGLMFSIRLGANNLNDRNALTVSTDTYFLHPDYDPATLSNDVGLIKLQTAVQLYENYIWPITLLAAYPLPEGASVLTAGWGQTSDDGTGLVDDLRYINLVALSDDECKLAFGNQVNENMVCLAGNDNGGTCRGDLGSPLIQYSDNGFLTYHVGISTFISSNGCESSDPSGFTRTWPYAMWIINTTLTN